MLKCKLKKVFASLALALTVVATTVAAPATMLASETIDKFEASDWQPILNMLTEQINVGTIIGVLAAAIGAGLALVFMWWGIRKLIRVVMTAFKTGKLKI